MYALAAFKVRYEIAARLLSLILYMGNSPFIRFQISNLQKFLNQVQFFAKNLSLKDQDWNVSFTFEILTI